MARPRTVDPARPEELGPAFRLIFRHAPARDREARVANALELVRRGDLDPSGVLVVRGVRELAGAVVCATVPGAGGLVWPPRAEPGSDGRDVEDRLAQAASAWLRQRGAKLAQALLSSHDLPLAAPLERNGFAHITGLWYMRHELDLPTRLFTRGERLTYQSYAGCDRDTFHRTLWRTYEGTLDCPEVNGVRTVEEVITGHRHQGVHDPAQWWLAFEAGRPAGVLLLTDMPEWDGWDLAYLGLVPEARGRGLGQELALKALVEARAAEASQLTLSVDARNRPAWALYRSAGFEAYDQREVFLAVWR